MGESPSDLTILNATIPEDFYPNSLLNINSNYTILKFTDSDFTSDYGLPSVQCWLNDTRFYIDVEYMMQELAVVLAMPFSMDQQLSLPIRVSSSAKISRRDEPLIWLSVTCEDNYFARSLKPQFNTNAPLLIRVNVLEAISAMAGLMSSSGQEWFDRDQFFFAVDENFMGVVGEMATAINEAAQALDLKVAYEIEGSPNDLLGEHLKVDNEGELEVIKGFDYERGERLFNFSVAAHLSDAKNPLKVLLFKGFSF